MGTVGAGFSMSLDGFIAGPGDDISRVFAWMFSGDTDVKVSIGDQIKPVELESTGVIEAPGVTHLIDKTDKSHTLSVWKDDNLS